MKKISYSFFTYNIIKQNGEEWIRESFDSIKNQSDDIIVVDCNSDDNIKEIAEEYGFRFFRIIEKNLRFHDAKMFNKAVYESKYDLFVPVTPDAIFDKDLSDFILEWFEKYGFRKYILFIYYLNQIQDKTIKSISGFSGVFYKPLLYKIRGCDERTYIRGGSQKGAHRYTKRIMLEVYCLKPFYTILENIHRYHPVRRFSSTSKVLSNFTSTDMIESLKENFNEGVKTVVNSYF